MSDFTPDVSGDINAADAVGAQHVSTQPRRGDLLGRPSSEWPLALLLFIILCAVYLLTYRGIPLSRDELYIFDSAQSFARRGNFDRTFQYNQVADPGVGLTLGADGSPWPGTRNEPLTVILMAPLVWLGQRLPSVGILHTVWLFNIAITTLTAVSLYTIALWLGYSPRTAFLAGLAYGIGTNAWAYSNLIFREPLMALFTIWLFGSALMVGRAWRDNNPGWRWMAGVVIFFLLAFLTKVAALLLLPGLFVILIPPADFVRHQRPTLLRLGVLIAGIAALIALALIFDLPGERFSLSGWRDHLNRFNLEYTIESLLGYQISLGRSLWLYSPVLLLALPGAWMLWKRGQWRLVTSIALTVLAFSLWYGVALVYDWWGGWGWGPRYMLPLLPLLMLCALPIFERFTSASDDIPKHAQRRWSFITFTLILAGIAINLLGWVVPLSNYYTDLLLAGKSYGFNPEETVAGLVGTGWHWMQANWSWHWSPLRYHLDWIGRTHLDIAWFSANPRWLPPLLALVIIALAVGFGMWFSRTQNDLPVGAHSHAPLLQRRLSLYTRGGVLILLLPLILTLTIALGLLTLRHDPRIIGDYNDVADLVNQLDGQVNSGDAVFIDNVLYMPIFMNDFKSSALVATLPYAPGESYGPSGPQVVSDDPIQQAGYFSVYALDWSADHYPALWLVASAGPFEADKRRPIEHYLVDHYFPVSEISTSPRARAIRFLPVDAPQGAPSITSDYDFGESLTLTGFDLPIGTDFTSGAVIPLSLVWQPQAALDFDYNIGLYLLDGAGAVVAQQDGSPQATFGAMSRWQLGTTYRDNHGLALPSSLPPGDYHLAVAVYNWQTNERLAVSAQDSTLGGDFVILTTIRITD